LVVICILNSACQPSPSAENQQAQRLQPVALSRTAAGVEFSQITGVGADSRGNIYVGDRLGSIVVVSEDGSLVRRFGRMGHGPGEFQSVATVHLLENDSLFVYDGYAQRATVYVPHSDRVAYTIRFPQPDFSFPMDVEPTAGGVLIAHFRRINGDVPIAGRRRDDVIRSLNRDGSVRRDTILAVPEPEVVEIHSVEGQGFFFPEFARQTLVRWDDKGRIYSLWTDSARVSVHAPNGSPSGSFTVELPEPRLPIATSTLDSIAELSASPGFAKHTLREAFSSRWQTWPLVQDMLVDDQSRIWILPVSHAPQVSWHAFDAGGKQLARLQLPRTVHPRLIRGDRMYAVSRDSLDVESLVVYRLAPSSTRTPEGS
jgi:hypothetical protein